MQRHLIFNGLFLLLVFIAGCAKAPQITPQPVEQQATPKVVEQPEPVEKPIQSMFPVKRGSLVIMSDPAGAEIRVDDQQMDKSPLALRDVPAGSYRIEANLEHYEVWRGEANVQDQKTAEVRIELKPKPGSIEVRTEPVGAKVQINNEDAGPTPFSKWLPAGVEHSITVSADGYYPESRKVTLQPEGREVISVALKEIPKGALEVKSEPVGASVWIDGEAAGVTPYSGSLTADEEHDIIVSKEGYLFKGQKVTIRPKSKDVISITLEKQEGMPASKIGKDGAEMLLIPAGEFIMGSPEGEGVSDEHPQHTVFLDAFYMDKHEVTNARYKQFMDATGYPAPGYWNDENCNQPDQPVVGVSWEDATAYADWAGKRLPTEAEWEKAARGGLVGKKYPWGDAITHNDANYEGIGGKDRWTNTSPVGSFAPNGYGLFDMAGNVWEWCADWYDSEYYSRSPGENPEGPDSGSSRVLRGGGWIYDPDSLRVAYRYRSTPTRTIYDDGFRCAGL